MKQHLSLILLITLMAVAPIGAQEAPYTPVTKNADWTPIEHDFDGVAMMLVPPGCFMMGNPDGIPAERPVHEICFEQAFWIDKYEVTQEQFVALGGEPGYASEIPSDNYPMVHITWFEARDFCILRGARLPTEAEWEYAARGPDGWIYAWGNVWKPENVIWKRPWDRPPSTEIVGTIPEGASWVGALDMIGNVLEWTNSVYRPYPYSSTDGREEDTGDQRGVQRVLRGGSWRNSFTSFMHAAYRVHPSPDRITDDFGFRCALDDD